MGAVSLTGSDGIQLDDRVLNNLADQDAVALTYPNDFAVVKTAKNGNTIYAFNESGRQVEVVIRLLLGSSDDKWLQSRLQEQLNDESGFILLNGTFTKRVGDGKGNVNTVVYQCTGGVVKKLIEAKTSAEGDVEQSVAVYTVVFGNGDRSIQ